jgi:ParB-like chromosome segregation protein Spo0J
MARALTVEVEGKRTLPLDSLIPFQEDIKRLERPQYEKFRNSVLDLGISFTIHVWSHKNKWNVIDGHQRVTGLKMMRDEEGFKVPAVPVSIVKAKTLREAKLKVLAGTSQYGTFDERALEAYLQNNKIDIDFALKTIELSGVDLVQFSVDMPRIEDLPKVDLQPPTMKVSSGEVRQVQLYFGAKDYEEFIKLAESLAAKYETENISDTVLGALREATGNKKSK